MSYTTRHTYGIGMKTDAIKTDSERIEKFVSLAPQFKAVLDKLRETEYNGENPDYLTLYSEYGDFGSYNIAGLIYEVIKETEDIRLCPCDDFDSFCYILFAPFYPWECTTNELAITEDSLKELFEKYLSYLTEKSLEELEYGEWDVENGG